MSCPALWTQATEQSCWRISNHRSAVEVARSWSDNRPRGNSPLFENLLPAGVRSPFQRFANCEQEDGTLAFRMRRKKVNHVIIEECQPGRTQALGIRGQVHPAADCTRLQLDGPVAAVPISLQDGIQVGEKENVHAGVRWKILLQAKLVGLGAEFPFFQKLQGVALATEEVSTRLEPLHRMHDQVKVVELRTVRLKKVSRQTSRGAVENG